MIESINGVESACVVGVPDIKVQNLSTAIVVKRQGFEELAEHDILSAVAEKLPHTKHLYGGVFFIQEMPLSVNGKVLRRFVREIAITRFKNRINMQTSENSIFTQ